MHKYNIIYTPPGNGSYLWNGAGFDRIEDEDREALLYSGKSVKTEDADEALAACRAAIKTNFPADENPGIKKVEVKVS